MFSPAPFNPVNIDSIARLYANLPPEPEEALPAQLEVVPEVPAEESESRCFRVAACVTACTRTAAMAAGDPRVPASCASLASTAATHCITSPFSWPITLITICVIASLSAYNIHEENGQNPS